LRLIVGVFGARIAHSTATISSFELLSLNSPRSVPTRRLLLRTSIEQTLDVGI